MHCNMQNILKYAQPNNETAREILNLQVKPEVQLSINNRQLISPCDSGVASTAVKIKYHSKITRISKTETRR